MPRSEDFQGRVNYAAAVISNGRRTSRTFDSCFENHDGDEVATILIRRAENNPRLAANLFRYLAKDTVTAAAERLKDVSTRDMPRHAAETRERARIEFQKLLDELDRKHAAIRQRARDAGYTVAQVGPYKWSACRPDGSTLAVDYDREDMAWHFAGLDAEKIAA